MNYSDLGKEFFSDLLSITVARLAKATYLTLLVLVELPKGKKNMLQFEKGDVDGLILAVIAFLDSFDFLVIEDASQLLDASNLGFFMSWCYSYFPEESLVPSKESEVRTS